jgi:hypothetical protein
MSVSTFLIFNLPLLVIAFGSAAVVVTVLTTCPDIECKNV